MNTENSDDWVPPDEPVLAGFLISVFGGFGLGSYRLPVEDEASGQLRRLTERRKRAAPSVVRRPASPRGDVWRFKHIQSMPSQHGGTKRG